MWPDPARLMGFPALAGMDPDWRGLFQDAFRLPRARGDGPVMNRLMLESWWASPRSRGWTPQRLTRAPQFGGFPALAGMDPPASPAASGSPGLPRARGDGPVHADRPQRRRLASPRSRGWTPLGGGGTGCDPGFPALAGMDPRRSSRRSGAPARASPRSRGWTVGLPQSHGDQRGFPALAGMDPTSSMQPPPRARLPRARGDGPGRPPPGRSAPGASPRSRGWTRKTLDLMPDLEGFPALAGMDRGRGRGRIHRRRLPRARGDGPCHRRGEVGEREASPRSRGWTLAEAEPARLSTGFPALAGMDLFQQPLQRQAGRLPRARGDGPPAMRSRATLWAASPRSRGWTRLAGPQRAHQRGFPALAGMDPRPDASRRHGCGLPRARGDGPRAMRPGPAGGGASPRSRGWTRSSRLRRRTSGGFPALAGMDPAPLSGRPIPRRLPRARGDGPVAGGHGRVQVEASPRSRGWTLSRAGARPGPAGFPALAGMDLPGPGRLEERLGLPRARGDGPEFWRLQRAGDPASPRSRGWTPDRAG